MHLINYNLFHLSYFGVTLPKNIKDLVTVTPKGMSDYLYKKVNNLNRRNK